MSNSDEIKKLKDLLDEGAISEEEYNSQKKNLFSNEQTNKNESSTLEKIFKYLLYAYNICMGLFAAYVLSYSSIEGEFGLKVFLIIIFWTVGVLVLGIPKRLAMLKK